MRQLTTGEELWMVNYISRGLDQLNMPVTPERVETQMHKLRVAQVRTTLQDDKDEVPPAPDLHARIRGAHAKKHRVQEEQRANAQGEGVPPPPDIHARIRAQHQ